MNQLTNFWSYISNLGVDKIDDPKLKRRLKLFNRILLISIVPELITFSVFTSYTSFSHSVFILVMAIIEVLGLVGNKMGYHRASRFYNIATSILVVTYLSLLGGREVMAHFIIITMALTVFAVYDFTTEKKTIAILLALIFTSVCFLEFYGYDNFDPVIKNPEHLSSLYIENVFTSLLLTLIFTMIFAYDNQKAEQNLTIAKKVAEEAASVKAQFLSNMSHEMRTPLNSILGFLKVVDKSGLEKEQQNYLNYANRAAYNMLELVNDVLDFSKFESETYKISQESVDLKKVVEEVVAMQLLSAQMKGLELKFHYDSRLNCDFLLDPVRMRQVMSNLISNAIKFTDKGGVEVSIVLLEKGELTYRVAISVKDTGLGIPPEFRDRIFEDFTQAEQEVTRRFEGTGLGLSIVKKIVDLMKGEIRVTENQPAGSVFTLNLDLTPGKQGELGVSIDDSWHSRKQYQLNACVVDDNEMNQLLLKKMLSSIGVKAQISFGGSHALELLKNNEFDVLFVDLQMPELSGDRLHDILRKEPGYDLNRNTEIVFVTADVFSETQQMLKRKGVKYILNKPIEQERLEEVFQELSKA